MVNDDEEMINAGKGNRYGITKYCRLPLFGDLVPGIYSIKLNLCCVPWGGLEHCKKSGEILMGLNGHKVSIGSVNAGSIKAIKFRLRSTKGNYEDWTF